MRILVYGAGVIGSLLTHKLCKSKNEITLLARGKWKETIDKEGLIIKHSGYFYKTRDRVKTISKLEKNDKYDLVFVVMQYNQIINVLKELGENMSTHIVLVGNNMNPAYCEEEINKYSSGKKSIAFGFQGSGGYRKDNMVVSMHNLKIGMTIGGLRNELTTDFKDIIKQSFKKTGYSINFEYHMEGWLLSHAAHILPGCYLCYAYGGNLQYATKKDAEMSAVATSEAHKMLKSLGYPICPYGEEEEYSENFIYCAKRLHFMYRTIIGKFVISNHCNYAVNEMSSLDKSFNDLRKNVDANMIVWDELRKRANKVLLYKK